MFIRVLSLVLITLGVPGLASAELLVKNPDLPMGGVAVDIHASTIVNGNVDRTLWDLIDFVPVGGGLIADGLTVRSSGELGGKEVGVSLMAGLSATVTVQVHYRYTTFNVENIQYTSAGALTTPNLRLDDSYESTADNHSLGLSLRWWIGTD